MLKLRELEDKVFNIAMQFSPAEQKVREATNDDEWGPTNALLEELAELTRDDELFPELMGTLFNRIKYEQHRWRRVNKGLIVLHYLILNGSERVIACCREHRDDLKDLELYKKVDEFDINARDQRIHIEKRVEDILLLIGDDKRLREERKRTKSNKSKYVGISSPSYESSKSDNFAGYSIGDDITDRSKLQTLKDSFSRIWPKKYDYCDYVMPDEGEGSETYTDGRRLQATRTERKPERVPNVTVIEDRLTFKLKELEEKKNKVETKKSPGRKIDLGKAADLSAFGTVFPNTPSIQNEQNKTTTSNFVDFAEFGDFETADLPNPLTSRLNEPTLETTNTSQLQIETNCMPLPNVSPHTLVPVQHTHVAVHPTHIPIKHLQGDLQHMQPRQLNMQARQPVMHSMHSLSMQHMQPGVQTRQPIMQYTQQPVQFLQPAMQPMHPMISHFQPTRQSIQSIIQSTQASMQYRKPATQSIQPMPPSNMFNNVISKPNNNQPYDITQPTNFIRPSNNLVPSNATDKSTATDRQNAWNGNNLDINLGNFTNSKSNGKKDSLTLNQMVEMQFCPQGVS